MRVEKELPCVIRQLLHGTLSVTASASCGGKTESPSCDGMSSLPRKQIDNTMAPLRCCLSPRWRSTLRPHSASREGLTGGIVGDSFNLPSSVSLSSFSFQIRSCY
ncbi:hypothetical protein PAHAL_4G191800 [Panicum hallii]|uniref:Uncharacterized protein n=1 Tax=Panicum hallii TaxID=206008 RepID=A0A2S3HJ75_9POAL|nr:hypothetical protein PAHAL_4G191800 [Panicum hallii]